MIRHVSLAVYLLGAVLASASESATRRLDTSLQEQSENISKKLPAAQSFVLGNTELRLDNSKDSNNAPVVQPVNDASKTSVTLRQPLNENAALSFSNEFGSKQTQGLPFSSNENSYSLDRREIWSFDWARSNWNGRAYTETQSSGDNQVLLTSQQTAHGLRTGTKLFSATELSAELRQENRLQAADGVAERIIYQTQLSQKLPNLPLTLELTPGLENETGLNGDSLSQSTRFNHALRWQATPETKITMGSGLHSKGYFDATREESMLYYSQFDTTLKNNLTFSLRSDFQDLTRNSSGSPAYQEQKVNFQLGPRLRLPENFTAALDMRYGFSQERGSNDTGTAEQSVALSIQGKF